jgi:hypothetical protein
MGEIAIIPILSSDPLFAFFIASNNSGNLEESTIVTIVDRVEYPNSTTCAPLPALTFCFSLPKTFES